MLRDPRFAPLAGASLLLVGLGVAHAGAPRIVRSPDYLDSLLNEEYNGGTPLRTTGPCLWAAHPLGWGFPNDIHFVHFNHLQPFRLDLHWQGQGVTPGADRAHVSHLATFALPVADLALNPGASGFPLARSPNGEAWAVVDGDRRLASVWSEGPAAGSETWLELTWPAPHRLGSVLFTLVENGAAGHVLPAAYRVEWLGTGGWEAVSELSRFPPSPVAADNRVTFLAVDSTAIRVVFTTAAPIAVTELEAYGEGSEPLALVERKLISDDDVLISVLEATNLGRSPATLTVRAHSSLATRDGNALTASTTIEGMPVSVRLEMPSSVPDAGDLVRSVTLTPGVKTEVRIAMAFGSNPAQAASRLAASLASPDPVAEKGLSAEGWFRQQVPQIDVPDPWFEKAYAFRWEVARRNLMRPSFGLIQRPTFAEGRWSARWFAQPITYGAPLQLREVRWLRDPAFARDHALTFVDNARPDGAFVGVTVTDPVREYTDWIASAIWEVFLVTGDTDLLAESVAAMAKNVDYVLTRDGDGDRLPVQPDHYETGMEWQPAWFYFSNYDTSSSTPLERVDYAAALFGNAKATARTAAALCDPTTETAMQAVATAVQAAVVSKMWDPATSFYYSLRADDDSKALVREIVGFYPLAFDLAPRAHDPILARLGDPAEFWTLFPPASSSLTCPATSQEGWPIGPGGSAAMWNGPTWPHAISLVGDAVGRALRRSGEAHFTREKLFTMLESYTELHYYGIDNTRDFSSPAVGEFYRGDRGTWKTSERDYFHSTYADLLLTLLFGIEPRADAVLRIDPLLPAASWDRFLVDRVRYRGHDVTLVWDEPGGPDAYGDGREGLDVWIDDRLAGSRPELGPLEVPLPPRRLLAVKDRASGRPLFELQGAHPWTLFRSRTATLIGNEPVDGSPFAGMQGLDPGPPPDPLVFYRAGACGSGL